MKIKETSGCVLLCCLILRASVFAGDTSAVRKFIDFDEVLRSAASVTRGAYPNADEVLLDEYIFVEYQTNGTSVTWDEEYIKVLTEKGKREQRSRSFHFTLPYGTVEAVCVRVIKPDGTTLQVDVAKQSRVMVDRSQMVKNIYNPNRKVLRVSIPDLEINDICHMVSRRDTVKARVPGTWSDYLVFEYTTPLKHIVYDVRAPTGLLLGNIVLRDEVQGTVSASAEPTEGGYRYRWEVCDVPRMFTEPNMPPLHTVVQRLLVSTIPDWETISRWYWNLCLPHLQAVTPALEGTVKELTRGAADRWGKTERLFRFVSQQIRYMGITTETEAPGYEPHDVSVTFENRYGVCRDKAALLVAMLRVAGVPAYPVLIHTGAKKDKDVPQPYFNHAIACAESGDGSYVLMDPTDENTTQLLPAYLCNKSYLVAHPEGEMLRTSPIDPATNNMVRIESKGEITDDGTLRAESRIDFDGINDNAYRGYFSRIKREEQKRFFEGVVKRRLSGATLTEVEILPGDMQNTTQALRVRLAYEAPGYLIKGQEYTMITPPWLGRGIGYANFVLGTTGLQKRKYPLFTEIACGVTETFRLDLAGTVGKLAAAPDYAPIETNTVRFSQTLDFRTNCLRGSGLFLLKTVEFSTSEYLALKEMLKDIEYERRKRPVFGSASATERSPDVLILFSKTAVDLQDEHNWTTRHSVTKQILTYAGKKKNAELKLNYNPAWENVRVEDGLVRNPDGNTHELADEEVNIMDAGWVGSAPRYPAAKTMVVSLPGVELGSLIEYDIVRERKGWPFLSLRKSFNSLDPVYTNVLSVSMPESLDLRVLDNSGENTAFRESRNGGRRVLEWIATNQSSVPKEDDLPPWWSFNPTVFVSGGDWKVYVGSLRAALDVVMGKQEKTRGKARKLIEGEAGAEDKALAIRDFVAKSITAAGPALSALPFSEVSPPDRTLSEGYGNTTDRALVLLVMLDEAGLEPEIALSSSQNVRLESLYSPLLECPQRGFFDEVLVRFKLDEAYVYLNDSDQYAKLGSTRHDGRPGVTLDGTIFTVRALPRMRDRSEKDYLLEVTETGDARITVTERFFGTGFGRFHRRFAELPPEERRRYYRELVAKISQAAEPESDLITEYDRYPGTKVFTATIERYAVRSGHHLYFNLPSEKRRILPLRSDRREGPLFRREPADTVSSYRIRLPDSAKEVYFVPEDISWNAPAGLGSLEFRTVVPVKGDDTREIEIRREVHFDSAVIPVHDYSSLVGMNRKISHPAARTILVGVE